MCAVPKSTPVSARIQDAIVSRISDKTLTELRIARAYVKLLCIPEGSSKASVSLAWIGNCEIRIFEGSQINTDGMPLFWLELFDHGAKLSVDTFSCNEIEGAVVVFEDFIAQANHLNQASGSDGAETHS
jgi:hypothetical protein